MFVQGAVNSYANTGPRNLQRDHQLFWSFSWTGPPVILRVLRVETFCLPISFHQERFPAYTNIDFIKRSFSINFISRNCFYFRTQDFCNIDMCPNGLYGGERRFVNKAYLCWRLADWRTGRLAKRDHPSYQSTHG